MKDMIKNVLHDTPLYAPLRRWKQARDVAAWRRRGRPVPPPHGVKSSVLRQYAKRFALENLVETGTHNGGMLESIADDFRRVWSIELDPTWAARARRRFARKTHVRIIEGDSGAELARLVPALPGPTLFWLDAHYSGVQTATGELETPIVRELEHIFAADERRHVMIIDDAREFGVAPDYPTLGELQAFVLARRPGLLFDVQDDVIRITPR